MTIFVDVLLLTVWWVPVEVVAAVVATVTKGAVVAATDVTCCWVLSKDCPGFTDRVKLLASIKRRFFAKPDDTGDWNLSDADGPGDCVP